MRPIVSYPPRPATDPALGYNVGGALDHAHVDLAVAGGASLLRTQFGWNSVEDYFTGDLSLTNTQTSFLSYCASKGVKPMIVAAYGPPRTTIGTLTTTADIPAGSPAGTRIPVASYRFSIPTATPACFVSAPSIEVGGVTLTRRWSYYGSLITGAPAYSIELAARTLVDIPRGTTLHVQRLRYNSPVADSDKANSAFIRYARYLASQIANANADGYVTIWNEYVWPHDLWGATQSYYDVPPSSVTLSRYMHEILRLAQTQERSPGVSFTSGVTDKTGFASIVNQGIAVPGSITAEGIHPYGNNPEQFAWDYYRWGFENNRLPPPSLAADDPWWATVNPKDQESNFRFLAFLNNLTPHAPHLMASECGMQSAHDTIQARYLSRRVASLWGVGVTPIPYVLDDGSAVGSNTPSLAPSGTPRRAYYSLRSMVRLLSRVVPGNERNHVPTVLDWKQSSGTSRTPRWPLMATTFYGAARQSAIFLWAMTNDSSGGSVKWSSIHSPAPATATVELPSRAKVAECFDVVTGHPVDYTHNGTLKVQVADNPVAVRLT